MTGEFGESFNERASKLRRLLMKHRERYVRAFMAETGLKPSECELVEQHLGDGSGAIVRVRARTKTDIEQECIILREQVADLEATLRGHGL